MTASPLPRLLWGALLAGLGLGTGLANGIRLPSQDNAVVARGYADVATADRPSAVYYNPAGLAQIGGAEALEGAYIVTPLSSYTSFTGRSVSGKKETFVQPYFYAAIPLVPLNGEHVTLGLGAYSPFGLGSTWPDDSGFRTWATANSIRYTTGALALAVPVLPGLEIGISLQLSHQHTDLNRGLGYYPGDRFHFAGNGTAGSFAAGVRYTPTPEHAFGLNFQSKTNFRLRGTANLDPLGIAYSGYADWVYPENVSVGYSYRPAPDWNIEFDYDWTNWKRLKNVVLYSAAFPPTPLPFNWKSSAYYNLGATHAWGGGWSTSAGVSRSTNSVPPASFNPSLVDVTKTLYNLGFGYKFGRWTFDAVLQYSPTEQRTISGLPLSAAGESVNGVYSTHLWAEGISAGYRF